MSRIAHHRGEPYAFHKSPFVTPHARGGIENDEPNKCWQSHFCLRVKSLSSPFHEGINLDHPFSNPYVAVPVLRITRAIVAAHVTGSVWLKAPGSSIARPAASETHGYLVQNTNIPYFEVQNKGKNILHRRNKNSKEQAPR